MNKDLPNTIKTVKICCFSNIYRTECYVLLDEIKFSLRKTKILKISEIGGIQKIFSMKNFQFSKLN